MKIKKSNEELIESNMKMVHQVANKIYYTLPPGKVEKDDLVSEGYIGLIKASKKYDYSKNDNFEAYARIRVSGAIKDFLRKLDMLPQEKRREIKHFQEEVSSLEQSLGRRASSSDILSSLNITKNKYQRIMNNINISSVIKFDKFEYNILDLKATEENSVEDILFNSHHKRLRDGIEELDKRQQIILSLKYKDGYNHKEIAKILDISPARISQLHSESISFLKRILQSE